MHPFFPCGHPFFCSILLILPTTHFISLEGLLITLMLVDTFVLYCYRVLGPVDTMSWPLFTDEYKSCCQGCKACLLIDPLED